MKGVRVVARASIRRHIVVGVRRGCCPCGGPWWLGRDVEIAGAVIAQARSLSIPM